MEDKDGYKLVINGKDNRLDEDYNEVYLKKGIEVEKEHTNQIDIAKMIAKDHLDEFPDYYKGLAGMEQVLSTMSTTLRPEDLDNVIKDNEDRQTHTLTVRYNTYAKNLMDDPLVKIIAGLGYLGNGGHTFDVILDPHVEENIELEWDGDGSDKVFEIARDDEIIERENFGYLFE